jgi:hypothetical protein
MPGKKVQSPFRFTQVVQHPIAMNQVELTVDRKLRPVQVQGLNVAPWISLVEVREIHWSSLSDRHRAVTIEVVMGNVADTSSHFQHRHATYWDPQARQMLEPAGVVTLVGVGMKLSRR